VHTCPGGQCQGVSSRRTGAFLAMTQYFRRFYVEVF
jgi:hypothetical protein